ncbi:hypothetical protein [Pseudokineococcus sp. 1T1Z-3]|uniref:hypothetical protein n=1 Tax=Pseudokineococcus sp. 1T1Z-3 TaxID=3132745 RepID=UPI0030AD2B00
MAALSDTARRRAIVAGAVVLVVLVLLAGVLVAGAGREDTSPVADPTPSAPSPSAAAAPTPAETGDGCDPASASEALPTTPPADLEFEIVDRAIVPVSDTYGPALRTGPVWDCFSHSPMGAVMAAASISTLRVVGEDLATIGERQLVENAGREVYLDFVRGLGPEGVTAPSGGFNQPAGFRVDSYTPEQAVVSVASRTPNGALSAAGLTVLWEDGTWKLQLLDNGSETAALTPLVNLDDYVAWGL